MGVALLYLTLCSIRNRARMRLRRLREPRYLIGSVVGLLYVYSLFVRPGRAGGALSVISRSRNPIELAAATALFVVAALAWVWPGSTRPALAFSRADVQFLFPAPITRRQLICYKVLRSVLASLVGSAIVTMFFRPGSLAGGWMFFAGTSFLMVTLNVHLTGLSLSRESLGFHGLPGLARQWLPVACVGTAVVVVAGTIVSDWPYLATLERSGDIVRELERRASSGPAGLILWPFKILVRLPLAASPRDFVRALPGALLLLALNFLWVVRSDAAFEEASAELAEKVARVRRGPQPVVGRARLTSTPFTLSLAGPPETALLWKNLILLSRYSLLKIFMLLLPLIVIVGVFMFESARHEAVGEMLAILCLITAAVAILLGPAMIRNDLRQDLANLAVLKTWPIRGAAIVRGEVLAPTVVLSVVVWVLISIAAALSSGLLFDLGVTTTASRLSYIVAAMLLAPGLIATQVVVQNGIAVTFPAWVAIGTPRTQGVEVMGQRMLMMAGMFLVLVLAVVPAAIVAALAGVAIYLVARVVPVLFPAALAAIVLLAECALAAEAIGRMLDRTDVTAIDAGE